MGASDPGDWTEVALQAIADCLTQTGCMFDVDVALAKGAPHGEGHVVRAKDWPMPVRVHLGTADLPMLMTEAHLAIGSASVIAAERACLALPGVSVVTVPNQKAVGMGLAAAGVDQVVDALSIGDRGEVAAAIAAKLAELVGDEDLCRAAGRRAARAFDGLGVRRAVLAVEALRRGPRRASDGGAVTLRRVEAHDRELLHRWQCDPVTRRFARQSAPPTWDEHVAWFDRKMADPDCVFCMILHEGQPAGSVRLDRRPEGDGAEVSISVAPERYRLGLGRLALALIRDLCPATTIHATVLPGNEASHKLFMAAGYRVAEGGYVSVPEEV